MKSLFYILLSASMLFSWKVVKSGEEQLSLDESGQLSVNDGKFFFMNDDPVADVGFLRKLLLDKDSDYGIAIDGRGDVRYKDQRIGAWQHINFLIRNTSHANKHLYTQSHLDHPGISVGSKDMPEGVKLGVKGEISFCKDYADLTSCIVSKDKKMGIGTNLPEAKLHVFNEGSGPELRLDSAGSSVTGLRWAHGGTDKWVTYSTGDAYGIDTYNGGQKKVVTIHDDGSMKLYKDSAAYTFRAISGGTYGDSFELSGTNGAKLKIDNSGGQAYGQPGFAKVSLNAGPAEVHAQAHGGVLLKTANGRVLVHTSVELVSDKGNSKFRLDEGGSIFADVKGTRVLTLSDKLVKIEENLEVKELIKSKNIKIEETIEAKKFISDNGYYYKSDKRLKKDIKEISTPVATLNKLRGVNFNWKASNIKDIGFIAQEIEKVLPELVNTDKQTDYKSVKYANITAILVEAVKELNKRVEVLENQLKSK